MEIKKGKFGSYFTKDGKNYSIFKTYDVENLTEENITKIIEDKKKYEASKKKK